MSPVARRVAVLAALAAILLVAVAARAAAHPLGNFTVNTYSGLRVGPDRLVVDYVVDLAEIPTFQVRHGIDGDQDGRVSGAEAAGWRDRECPRLAGGLRADVDGRGLPLAVTASRLTFPKGVGGLETLRLECALAAPLPPGRSSGRALSYADANQRGRVGWRELTAVGDRTTLETADVPTTSASARLTTYPSDQLSSPLNQRTATLHFHPGGPPAPGWSGPSASGSSGPPATMPGATMPGGRTRESPTSRCELPRRGSVDEPGEGCARLSTAPAATTPVARGGVDRATAAFTGDRSRSPGFAVVAVLLAVALGAAHALAPGHGKTVMAAYLVGLRGTLGQAVTIGATVTVAHTAGSSSSAWSSAPPGRSPPSVSIPGSAWAAACSWPPSASACWPAPAPGTATPTPTVRATATPTASRTTMGTGTATGTRGTMGTTTATGTRTSTGTGTPRPGPRWAGGGWWRSAWPVDWCRARRRWWCCSAGSRSGGPGSGSRWCWPTGSGWRPPSPGSGCSWHACGPGWTGGSTCRPGHS